MQIIDADGHVNDRAGQEEIARYMPEGNRSSAIFPALDHLHFHYMRPKGLQKELRNPGPDEWLAFMDQTAMEWSVLYPTFGLAVGRLVSKEWAIAACFAYNRWLYDRFLNKSPKLKGMALIPIQHVDSAVAELRYAVEQLGIGLMVYAPYGRTGVYPMQSAFARLLAADPPEQKVRLARAVLGALPETNWFRRNDLVGDHRASDAGLHDLLLHARDRPYTVSELTEALERAGLAPVSFIEPARYDPLRYLPESPEIAERVQALSPVARAALAEELAGNLKTHVLYAARPGDTAMAKPSSPEAVPHLRRVTPAALSRHVARKGAVPVKTDGLNYVMDMPRGAARLIAGIDGRRSLGEIAAAAGLDWLAFAAAWAPVHRGLTGFNFLHYSRGARR